MDLATFQGILILVGIMTSFCFYRLCRFDSRQSWRRSLIEAAIVSPLLVSAIVLLESCE